MESFKTKEKKKKDSGVKNIEDEKEDQEDDLAQITGGKEAEVDQYTTMLHEITEN